MNHDHDLGAIWKPMDAYTKCHCSSLHPSSMLPHARHLHFCRGLTSALLGQG